MPGPVLAEVDEKNPVFLDDLIQLAETSVTFYYANVIDTTLRANLTDALKGIAETQLKWAAYVQKKTKPKYAEVHKKLKEGEQKIIQTYQKFVNSVTLDAPTKEFYEGLLNGLKETAEVFCDFYVLSRLAFLEGAEFELVISFDSLKTLWEKLAKVGEQPTHQHKDDLVDNYQEATEIYAQLAEATSNIAVQPTTDEPVRVVLNGFFDTLNDLNDALADEINVLLQAPPAKAKEVFPKTEFAYRELEYLINDLAIIIADERRKILNFKFYPTFLRAFELAKDSGALKQQLEESKESEFKDGSASKKLEEHEKATGKQASPALTDLAKNADKIDKGLKNITAELEKETPENAVIEGALQEIGPALNALPKNVDQVLKEETGRMNDAAQKGKGDLAQRIKELDDLAKRNDEVLSKLKDSTPSDPKDAGTVQGEKEEFRGILDKALQDVSPEKNVNIFGDDKGDNLRRYLDEKTHSPDVVATPTNAKDEAKKLADDIKEAKKKLDDYSKGLDDTAQKNSALANEMAKQLPPAAKNAGDNLVKAAQELMSAGPDGGRREKLHGAADDVSHIVDTAVGLIPGGQQAEASQPILDGSKPLADGSSIPQEQVDLAKAIERAREKVDKVEDAGNKEEKKALEEALKHDPSALPNLGNVVSTVLANEPERIKKAADKVDGQLDDHQKELDKIAAKAEALAKKVGDNSKPASPEDREALKDIQKALDKELSKAKDDVAVPNNPFLFSGEEPDTLRSDLNDKIKDVEKAIDQNRGKDSAPNAEVAKEAKKVAEQAKEAKDQLHNFQEQVPELAKEKATKAQELVKSFPEASKDVSAKLDGATKKAQENPKSLENKKDLQDAVDEANALIDAAAGLLHSAPVRSNLDDLERAIKRDSPQDEAPVTLAPKNSEAQRLADSKVPVPQDVKNLADALDRADKALQEVRNAGNSSKPSENLPKPLKNSPQPINEVGQAASLILASQPEKINDAAQKAKKDLAQRDQELKNLQDKVDDLLEKANKNGGKLAPQDAKALADIQHTLQEIAEKAAGDVSPDKNASLFNNPDAAHFRKDMDDIADSKPVDPKRADKDDVRRVGEDLHEAQKAIEDFTNKIDPEAKKQVDKAKDLAKDLPPAFAMAADELVLAGDRLAADEKSPEKKQALDGAANRVADLLDVARSLLPSSDLTPDHSAMDRIVNGDTKEDPKFVHDRLGRGAQARLGEWSKKRGVDPPLPMTDLADKVDKVDDALKNVHDTSKQPNPAAFEQAIKNVAPAFQALNAAADKALQEQPKVIDKDLERANRGLDERQRELAKLADEIQELKDKIEKGTPEAGDAKRLDEKKEKLRDIAQDALDDIAPEKNRNLFDSPKAEETRAFLNDLVNEKERPTQPGTASKDANKLADKVEDTREKLAELQRGLDPAATEGKKAAEDIVRDLPRAIKAVNDDLVKAADDLAKKGPEDGRKERLKDALEQALNLVDNTAGILPALPESRDVRSINNEIKNPQIPKNNDPVAQRKNTQQLEDWGQEKGIIPDAHLADLAGAVDKAEKALAEANKAMNQEKPDSGKVQKSGLLADEALKELGDAVAEYLKDAPARIQESKEKAKDGLDEGAKDLDELQREVEALQAKLDQEPSKPKPEYVADLDKKKKRFQDLAQKALDTVDPEKDIHLHSDPKSDDLRKFLNDQIKESEKGPTPTPPAQAPEEAKKLAEQIAKTKERLTNHAKDLDDQAKQAEDATASVANELPKALTKSGDQLKDATKKLEDTHAPADKAKANDEAKNAAALVDAAAALLPKLPTTKPLKDVKMGLDDKIQQGSPFKSFGKQPEGQAEKANPDVPWKRNGFQEPTKAEKLRQHFEEEGAKPTADDLEFAQNADRLDDALRRLAEGLANNDPKALEEAAKQLGAATNGFKAGAQKKLEQQPDDIAKTLRFKKKGLDGAKNDLDGLGDDLANLKKRFAAPNQGPPKPEDQEAFENFRDKLRKTAHLAKNALTPDNPNLFNDIKSQKLRALLDKLAKLEADPDARPAEELAILGELLDEAKDLLGGVTAEAEKNAQRSAELANRLRAQLPKELQHAADAVIVAANEVAQRGPGEGRNERLADALRNLEDLAAATGGLLPGEEQGSLKALERQLDETRAGRHPGSDPKTLEDRLADLARQDGVVPPEAAQELVENADKLDRLIAGVKDAMERGKDKRPNVELARAINALSPPVLAMAAASGKLLLAQEEAIKEAGAQAKQDLADADRQLGDLAARLEGLAKEMAKADSPTPAQLRELAAARQQARIAAHRAKNDIDFTKSPDLFGGQAAQAARDLLDDVASDPERDHVPPEGAREEAAKVATQLATAREELKKLRDQTEPLALRKAQLANKLASALPTLGQKANDRLVLSGSEVVQEGPGDGRREGLLDSLKNLEEVRDALADMALGQLPSAPTRADVDGISEAVKRLIGKDPSDPEKSHADKLADDAKKRGEPASDAAQRLADTADRVEKALGGVKEGNARKPEGDREAIGRNLAQAAPAASDLSHAVRDLLEERAADLAREGEQAQEALAQDAQDLHRLGDQLRDLEKRPDGKKLGDLVRQLDKALSRPLDETSPAKGADLFADPTTAKLREDLAGLRDTLGPDKTIPTAEVAREAARLADAAHRAANQVEDFTNGLPEKAAEQARLASDLATDLPKAIRDANAALVAAADKVLKEGPKEGRKERLDRAADSLQGLVDTATRLLPSEEERQPLRDVRGDVDRRALLTPPDLGAGADEVPRFDAARRLEQAARRAGDAAPAESALEVAQNVDKAASALNELALAVSDPSHLGGLADALGEAAPSLSDLARALGELLEQEPERIRDEAKRAKEALKRKQKELDGLAKEAEKLRNKIQASGKAPTPAEAKELAAFRKKFREVVQGAKEDVDPDKAGIFGNLRSNKLRAFLNGQLEDLGDERRDDAIRPEEVLEELKRLEDQATDSKKALGDFVGKLDGDAEEAAAEAKELATELPKYVRGLNSRLVTSARGIMATGPDDDLVDKMMSSRDQMARLLGSVASLLPGAKQKGDLGAILDQVKRGNRQEAQDTGVKEKNVARRLDQFARQKGLAPTDAMLRVARCCERLDSSLDEVLRAVTAPDRLGGLGEASQVTAETLEELCEALPVLLEAEVAQMEAAARRADEALEGHEQALAALTSELAAAQKLVAGRPGAKPTDQDLQALNSLRTRLAAQAQRALDDIAVGKSANLFGSPKAVKLRAQLNRAAKLAPLTGGEEAQAELEQLSRALADATSGVTSLRDALEPTVAQNATLARDLADQLPRLGRAAQDKIAKSSAAVSTEGLTEKRRGQVLDAVEAVASLVNIASSLLPSSEGRGDLRSARDRVEDLSDPADDGPYLDSFRQFYSDALRPPRPPKAAEPAASSPGATRKFSRFQNAARTVVARKQREEEQQGLRAKAGWGGKLAHLVSQLENPDLKAVAQGRTEVVLPEGAINQGFGPKKEEENRDSIWNQKGAMRVEKKLDKELIPRAGTLNHLILLFTSPMDGESPKEEGEFLRRSLLTLDTFTTPDTFLDKLVERYSGPKQRQLSAFEQNLQAKVQKRVCSALKTYIINRASQDLAYRPELIQRVRDFAKLVEKDSKFLAKDLTDCLALHTSGEQYKYHERCARGHNPNATSPADGGPIPFSKQLAFFNAQEVARQMTLSDAEVFRMIRLPELAGARWTGPDADKRAPNVSRMIQHGNRISIWVASGILQEEDPKRRKKVLTNMIVLCQHLINMNSFHAAKCVLAGLQSAPIMRLPFPGDDINERVRKLAANYEEKAESAKPPMIPFLGSVLKDIMFYEHDRVNDSSQGNPNIDWTRQAGLLPVLSDLVENQRLAVFKIPELPLRKAILQSIDELQKPVSALLKVSKDYATQQSEEAPQGSLSSALQKLQKSS